MVTWWLHGGYTAVAWQLRGGEARGGGDVALTNREAASSRNGSGQPSKTLTVRTIPEWSCADTSTCSEGGSERSSFVSERTCHIWQLVQQPAIMT